MVEKCVVFFAWIDSHNSHWYVFCFGFWFVKHTHAQHSCWITLKFLSLTLCLSSCSTKFEEAVSQVIIRALTAVCRLVWQIPIWMSSLVMFLSCDCKNRACQMQFGFVRLKKKEKEASSHVSRFCLFSNHPWHWSSTCSLTVKFLFYLLNWRNV